MKVKRFCYGLAFAAVHFFGFGLMFALIMTLCFTVYGVTYKLLLYAVGTEAAVLFLDYWLLSMGRKHQWISRGAICFSAAVDVVLAVFSTMLLVVFLAALFRGELAWADTVLSMCILSFTAFVVLRFMLLWRAYRAERKGVWTV